MTGIQFVTDEQGRKVGVLIDLRKHRAIREDFWDGLVSESRRKEKAIPYEQYRATRLKRAKKRIKTESRVVRRARTHPRPISYLVKPHFRSRNPANRLCAFSLGASYIHICIPKNILFAICLPSLPAATPAVHVPLLGANLEFCGRI